MDSHPVLTPRKIMSDRRLMAPRYRELRAGPLCPNGPFDAVAPNRWNSRAGARYLAESAGLISRRAIFLPEFNAPRLFIRSIRAPPPGVSIGHSWENACGSRRDIIAPCKNMQRDWALLSRENRACEDMQPGRMM